jgi:hypothetical protein
VIFSQDFSSSSIVSDYVNAAPNSGQWNAISTSGGGTTVSINSGALQYARTTSAGSFSRTTDFSPTPTAVVYKFDLSVSGNSVAQTSAAVWQIGSGFGTANSAEAIAQAHSRFAIDFTATPGTFTIHEINGATSANLSGVQSLMWVINNTGGSLSYVGADNQATVVANDTWDIWAGTTLIFDDKAATTTSQTLTDLKFAFTAGSGSITMDNFSIEAVPEPAEWGAISALGLMGICGLREWRQRRCGEKLKSCPVK